MQMQRSMWLDCYDNLRKITIHNVKKLQYTNLFPMYEV